MKSKKGWDIRKRWWFLTSFIDKSMTELSNAEIVIWLMLWRDTKKNGLAKTSISYLAKRSGMTERMIRKGIRSLIENGMLKRIKRGGTSNGKKWISLWRVCRIEEPEFPIPSKGTLSDAEKAAIGAAWERAIAKRRNGEAPLISAS